MVVFAGIRAGLGKWKDLVLKEGGGWNTLWRAGVVRLAYDYPISIKTKV
jgi:hypothetical protein